MKRELVIVIDFGGQYNQLVARRVRECNVYCEIYSYKTDLEKIKAMNPKGIILTGGPNSCYEADSPTYQKELFELGIPVLGLCYGAQLMMHVLGGKVEKADVSEYGKTELLIDKKDSRIFKNVSDKTICWMSHTDYISQTAPGFEIAAHTADCPVATAQNEEKKLYAIQFHPEVLHTVEGKTMLSNFVLGVCECAGDWKMDAFVEHTIKEIREKVGDGKVLLALSGGVDSSVAAGLLSRAIGKQLTCVFVDHGLLRKDEGDEVEGVFGPNGQFDLNFIRVNAQQRYYDKLAGVTEPEAKRKIIGEEFIRIFEEEAKKIGAVDFLAQGTIYPDVVESGLGGESAVIKSHHNVGGLPDFVDFKEIIEPGTIIGNLTDIVQESVGFDTKVIATASHDTASAVVSVPALREDFIYISSGTWSLMGMERNIADCSLESMQANFTNEGGYNHRFRYLKNIMGLWMIQSLRRELEETLSFNELCQMARCKMDLLRIHTLFLQHTHRLPHQPVRYLLRLAAQCGGLLEDIRHMLG